MTATFLSADIDTAQADLQIAAMVQLNSQITDIMLNAKLQEAQVLTPEQRATLLEFTTKLDQCVEDSGKIPSLFPDLVNKYLTRILLPQNIAPGNCTKQFSGSNLFIPLSPAD